MATCAYTLDPSEIGAAAGEATGGAAEVPGPEGWSCPHEAHPDEDRCVFHLSAAERETLGVTAEDVTDRFLDLFDASDPELKQLLGADLPRIAVAYRHLVGETRHPIDLRFSDVETLELDHTTVENAIDLGGARVGTVRLIEAEFTTPVSLSRATVYDELVAREVTIEEEFTADGATVDGPVALGEATFGDDAVFSGATFADDADFQAASFDATATFEGATFAALADFDESRFRADGTFADATFREMADFRGAEFAGGANALADDADFERATFAGEARFGHAEFGHADFHDVQFDDAATFQESIFFEDADFSGSDFAGLADFDEVRFREDGDFSGVTFEGDAHFRGATFAGEARHLEDNARFEGATFRGAAAFDDAAFTSANFRDVRFSATASFRDLTVREDFHMAAQSTGTATYVDMTGADVAGGSITQPRDGWVHYDLTRGHIGDVTIGAEGGDLGELFDYVRFLETDFDGFDFSAHRDSLDRGNWALHQFDDAAVDADYALEATPEHVETTYLYAYNNAKAMGDNDAAIEFAIHQARFRRQKNVGYVADGGQSLSFRASKLADVVGNSLWHLTCGYGYRLWRILAVSVFVVVTWGVLYALPFTRLDNGASLETYGALFSMEGLSTVARFTYYSLVTFTTVGYGDINPLNAAARTLAVTEGILGILLAALVVFVLGRRVAV